MMLITALVVIEISYKLIGKIMVLTLVAMVTAAILFITNELLDFFVVSKINR